MAELEGQRAGVFLFPVRQRPPTYPNWSPSHTSEGRLPILWTWRSPQ
jgi:hypothetical protein